MHLGGSTADQELLEHKEHNSGYSAPRWEPGLSWLVEHNFSSRLSAAQWFSLLK